MASYARTLSRLLWPALLLAVPACRGCGAGQGSGASASASTAIEGPAPSASAPRVLRLAPPFDAVLVGSTVRVAGPARDGPDLVVASIDTSGTVVSTTRLLFEEGARPSELALYGASGGVAVAIDDAAGQRRGVRATSSEGLRDEHWAPLEPSTCAIAEGLVSLVRKDEGFDALLTPFAGPAGETTTTALRGSSASITCGPRRAYVQVDQGDIHAARAVGDGPAADVKLSDDKAFGDTESSFLVQADEAGLLAVRLGEKKGLAFRSWGGRGEPPGPWATPQNLWSQDATLELTMAGAEAIAFVIAHPAEPVRPCQGDESDTVAELWVVGRGDGVVRRGPERLETWRCGAEAGPFWGGAVGDRFALAWPRGADSACAKVGVRYGGVAWASVGATGRGPVKVERVAAPAEAVEDAGCDAGRCAVVVLGRSTSEGCFTADDARAGEPRVVIFPAEGQGGEGARAAASPAASTSGHGAAPTAPSSAPSR